MPHAYAPSRNGVIEKVQTVKNNTTMLKDFGGRTHQAKTATGVQPILATSQHRSTTGKFLSVGELGRNLKGGETQLAPSVPCIESSSYCIIQMLKSIMTMGARSELVAAVFKRDEPSEQWGAPALLCSF
eukprot:16448482-Heterocapsa_arctica.AAC.1